MKNTFITVAEAGINDADKRTDRILRRIFPSMKLGTIYRELRKGRIRVNSLKTAPETRIKEGDTIMIHCSLSVLLQKDMETLSSGETTRATGNEIAGIKAEILFENQFVAALNKPAGISVHSGSRAGSAAEKGGSLADYVKSLYPEAVNNSLAFSPSPLHRLDRNTSGVVFFGKSIKGARLFSFLLREKRITKKYIALLDGRLERISMWEDMLYHDTEAGKSRTATDGKGSTSVTSVRPLLFNDTHTLAEVTILTGRYHQIRKQCSLHGHPLTGDVKYGSRAGNARSGTKNGSTSVKGYFLHCMEISLTNPEDEEEAGFRAVKAPIPEYFRDKILSIFSKNNTEKIADMLYS